MMMFTEQQRAIRRLLEFTGLESSAWTCRLRFIRRNQMQIRWRVIHSVSEDVSLIVAKDTRGLLLMECGRISPQTRPQSVLCAFTPAFTPGPISGPISQLRGVRGRKARLIRLVLLLALGLYLSNPPKKTHTHRHEIPPEMRQMALRRPVSVSSISMGSSWLANVNTKSVSGPKPALCICVRLRVSPSENVMVSWSGVYLVQMRRI